jgi:hypothetical protein
MIERLLEPGSTELPTCECGKEMYLAKTESKSPDTHLKIFECPACRREMRLMVWSAEEIAAR